MDRRKVSRRLGAVAATSALIAAGLAAVATQAEAAACKAYVLKVNWDYTRKIAAADVRVLCPSGGGSSVYFRMEHPTSSTGPCIGIGGSSRDYHYSFHPSTSWTPLGTSWRVRFCGQSGTGWVPNYTGSGSGGGGW